MGCVKNVKKSRAETLLFHYYVFSLFSSDITASQNTDCLNVISGGSPSRIRIVRLISFGITTLPRSSILLTIPVAFIYKIPFTA